MPANPTKRIAYPTIDLKGQRFDRLLVIEFGEWVQRSQRVPYWKCLCDCGTEKLVNGYALRHGTVKSCGCRQRESVIRRNTKHGMSVRGETRRVYRIWQAMLTRCTNPNQPHYDRYGGRGITICDRWTNSFEAFLEDMGEPPTDKHSLDRIDVDGDYCPENCRWATAVEQARNTTRNTRYEHDGKSLTLGEWSEIVGIPEYVLKGRINRYGWSVEKALTTKIDGRSVEHRRTNGRSR